MHIHWDEVLPHITFAYNCSKQDPTRCSPFQLIYVRNPTLPIDVALRAVVNEEPRKPKTDFAESVLATDYRSSEAGTNGPATGQWKTTTNTPTERRLPKKLLCIVPLLILSILVPPATPTLVNDIIQRDGVYFKPIAQVAMGYSTWTVVTNVNFDRINAMIKDMGNQLTVRKQITPLLEVLLYSRVFHFKL